MAAPAIELAREARHFEQREHLSLRESAAEGERLSVNLQRSCTPGDLMAHRD